MCRVASTAESSNGRTLNIICLRGIECLGMLENADVESTVRKSATPLTIVMEPAKHYGCADTATACLAGSFTFGNQRWQAKSANGGIYPDENLKPACDS